MYLYGASGHGKVVRDIVEAQGESVSAFVDDNRELSQLDGTPVVHHSEELSPIIVSIGENETRKKIAERLSCRFGTAIHPSAVVSPSAKIGEGTVVMPGAIVNAGAVIGKHCIVNTGASIDHECVLGDYCHVAPHASLCGQVSLGEGTLIGVGASVLPCVHVGDWSVIGAGAVVIRDIPAGTTAVGVPARIL
jgi:sugar O-acyltransferase (sialic acid O-acetyltransferase NeuD family)